MADKTIVVRAVYRSNVAQGMSQDAGAITRFSAQVESGSSKVINRTKALGAASAVAGKLLVLGIGGAMAVSAKAAIDFESSMAGVAKTTDLAGNSFDRNSGPLFQFSEALRQLSLRTPVNVNDLAKIAEMGGQLGIETENLVEFTEVMAAMGVSTNLSAEEAAKGFARFANIMGTSEGDFERLGSVVVELGNNFATTEAEILKFGLRIAPVGRTVGATEEEVFGLSAALTSLGIPAERGGTAIQKWMIKAKQAVDGGGESLSRFADVAGMTNEEFGKLFRESPGQAFTAFVKGLDQVSQSGQDVFGVLDSLQLAEVRTTQVLLAAAGGWETVASAMDTAVAEGEQADALFEEAARRYGTTASAIQLLGNSFNDLRIEIGNALLSSGGLAFAIDVAREFFGIIKDNLPTLRNMTIAIGILLALRAGVWFFDVGQKAVAAAKSLYTVSAANTAVTTSTRIAQGSMMLLTAGMQGALAVAGILATVWALAAINAAELRAKVKGLQQQIEQGADPFETIANSIRENMAQPVINQLAEAGISVEDFVRAAMKGGDAIDQLFDEAGRPFLRTAAGIRQAEAEVEGFRNILRSDLVNAMIESGNQGQLSMEEIRAAADRAIQEFGYDITGSVFVSSINQFLDATPGRFRSTFSEAFRGVGNEMGRGGMDDWTDFLDPADKEDTLEAFLENNIKAGQEYVEALGEQFEDVGEIVREGMPVWEEYERAVFGGEDGLPNFREVLAAQEAFLADTRDWIERMPDIMDMGATEQTVAWIDSLDAPIRGAIGRLNDTQLQELIDGANANFDELHRLHVLRWQQIYPDAANLAFASMVGELATRVEEMNLPGEAAGEAFMKGLMDIMAVLPEEDQAAFVEYLGVLFQDTQWMTDNGFTLGQDMLGGLLVSIKGWPLVLQQAVIKAVNAGIKTPIDDSFERKSPSKWMMRFGDDLMEGLVRGVQGQVGTLNKMFNPQTLMPAMSAGTGSMSTINNTRSSNISLTVNGGGNSNNIRAESQTLLTLLTIVGGVEAGAGK